MHVTSEQGHTNLVPPMKSNPTQVDVGQKVGSGLSKKQLLVLKVCPIPCHSPALQLSLCKKSRLSVVRFSVKEGQTNKHTFVLRYIRKDNSKTLNYLTLTS